MEIGILTFHNIPNIGAALQAFALCEAFRQAGVECELIDYTCKNIEKRELQSPKVGNPIKDLLIKWLIWPKTKKKIAATQTFMKGHHIYSKDSYTKKNLSSINERYDAVISGSDMIWNLSVTDYDWTYFCDFLDKDKKRYAYGSSIGDKWKSEDLDKVKDFLSRYSLIGVRESDTCDTLNEIGIKSRLVCDPTMLLEPVYWKDIAIKPNSRDYVLVYFPSDKNILKAKEYADKHDLKVVVMNWARPIKGMINISPLSPDEWIGYFVNASAVFTGSFHGLLFSLYFKKPVWTDNYSNRVCSILEKLGCSNCLIRNDETLGYHINYEKVGSLMHDFRAESLSYIKEIIEDCSK